MDNSKPEEQVPAWRLAYVELGDALHQDMGSHAAEIARLNTEVVRLSTTVGHVAKTQYLLLGGMVAVLVKVFAS